METVQLRHSLSSYWLYLVACLALSLVGYMVATTEGVFWGWLMMLVCLLAFIGILTYGIKASVAVIFSSSGIEDLRSPIHRIPWDNISHIDLRYETVAHWIDINVDQKELFLEISFHNKNSITTKSGTPSFSLFHDRSFFTEEGNFLINIHHLDIKKKVNDLIIIIKKYFIEQDKERKILLTSIKKIRRELGK